LKRSVFLTLGLLGVFLLSACAPTTPAPSEVSDEAPVAIPTNAEETTIITIPTSRGDQLQATDPATVNIASGEPQLIEFFAFW